MSVKTMITITFLRSGFVQFSFVSLTSEAFHTTIGDGSVSAVSNNVLLQQRPLGLRSLSWFCRAVSVLGEL